MAADAARRLVVTLAVVLLALELLLPSLNLCSFLVGLHRYDHFILSFVSKN